MSHHTQPKVCLLGVLLHTAFPSVVSRSKKIAHALAFMSSSHLTGRKKEGKRSKGAFSGC
jgi:hypothetical protein